MIYAAVLAGGKGLRMGGDIPKQFLCIDGRPVIIRSIDAFARSGLVDKIYVAVSADNIEYTRSLIAEFIGEGDITVVAGGKNRNETLFNVIKAIDRDRAITCEDIILTHDAVRPFIDSRIIKENIEYTRKYGACDTVVPAVDTIVQSEDGLFITGVPVRSEMFHGQTPQSFNMLELTELYENMSEDEFEFFTDACSVFIKYNKKVALVKGSRNNIKITYPEDIEKAEMIVREGKNDE